MSSQDNNFFAQATTPDMTEERKNQKQKGSELKTYTIPFSLGEIKESIINTPGSTFNLNKEQILVKANKLYLQGKLSEAKKYLKYLLASGLTHPVILLNYGSILGTQGELKEAEQSLREAIKLKPDFAEAHFNLGNVLRDMGDLKKAELSHRKAIQIKPGFAEAHYNLGNILNDIGNLQEAESSTRQAIEIKADIKYYLQLAIILSKLGKTKESNITKRIAIKFDPFFKSLKSRHAKAEIIDKVALYVDTYILFNHYKPILEFNQNDFEILLPTHMEDGLYLKLCKELKNKGIRIRMQNELYENNLIYKKIISNHALWKEFRYITENNKKVKKSFPCIKLLGKKNIRFMYSAGYNKYNFSEWNIYYDGILCYGPYHQVNLEERFDIPIAQMGYPRFDRYFNTGFKKDNLIKKFKCDPNKKNIVWLTTISNLSSIEKYYKAISALKKSHNIVVRPHPHTKIESPEEYKKLLAEDFTYIDDSDEDNLPLFALADLMLLDYGGSMFGSLYINRNFAFLDMGSETTKNLMSGASTSEDYLKSFFPDRIAKPENVETVCNYCLENPPSKSIMKTLREEFFNTNYQGSSAKRAYDLITSDNWIKSSNKLLN